MPTLTAYVFAYLVNSLWQAALLYVAAAMACRLGRNWTPESKHRIWSGTLLAQILLPAACLVPNFVSAGVRQAIYRLLGWAVNTTDARVNVSLGAAHPIGPSPLPQALVSTFVTLYAAAVLFFGCRLLYQLWQVHTLRRQSRPALMTEAQQQRWHALRIRMQVNCADPLSCPAISGPVTIGIRYKLLLMPDRFLTVSHSELDAAFAHELAHMQRNDYSRNLVYEVLFLFAAFHPCVRLTRAWLAETREMVCDGMAARALHGAEPYAHALLRLASFCLPHQPAVPSQAIGIFDANTLERRLMSLKARPSQASWKQRLVSASAGTALLFGASASALAFHVGVPAPSPQAQQAAPSNSLRVSSSVMAEQVISHVQPVYPEAAKQAGIQGSVVLSAVIGKDGHIDRLTVVSGPQELQTSALDAVRQWVYKPFQLNGEPVEVETTINVNYQLAD